MDINFFIFNKGIITENFDSLAQMRCWNNNEGNKVDFISNSVESGNTSKRIKQNLGQR